MTWQVRPFDEITADKIVAGMSAIMRFVDNFHETRCCGQIAPQPTPNPIFLPPTYFVRKPSRIIYYA